MYRGGAHLKKDLPICHIELFLNLHRGEGQWRRGGQKITEDYRGDGKGPEYSQIGLHNILMLPFLKAILCAYFRSFSIMIS